METQEQFKIRLEAAAKACVEDAGKKTSAKTKALMDLDSALCNYINGVNDFEDDDDPALVKELQDRWLEAVSKAYNDCHYADVFPDVLDYLK